MTFTPRTVVGVLLAAAFLATGLWYGLGTFTVTASVEGRPASIDGAPETRTMTIECHSDGSSGYVSSSGEAVFFNTSWAPESPKRFCDDARRGRLPLAVGLGVIGTVIGVFVAASGSRRDGDD